MSAPQPHSVRLVFTPAVNDITEMAAYVIHRNIDGGEFEERVFCAVIRDMLGSIVGIDNCTTPIVPSDADKQLWREMPVTYVDTDVGVNHTYCYAIQAFPLGNNMSNNQGPPSALGPQVCIQVLAKASTPVLQGQVINNNAVLLDWTASDIEDSTIDHYQVWKNQDGGAFVHAYDSALLELEDDAVAINHVYQYFVIAVPVLGINSDPSNIVTETLAQYRTSALYAVELIETITSAARPNNSPSFAASFETLTSSAVPTGGTFASTLDTYSNWPPETLTSSAVVTGGANLAGLDTYTNGLPETLTSSAVITGGTLTQGLLTYTDWPPETLTSSAVPTGGTLT